MDSEIIIQELSLPSPPPAQPLLGVALCGVYFLWKGASVVYVGQSRNMISRLGSHLANKLDFDGYSAIAVPAEDLDAYEAAYTLALRPRYNLSADGAIKAGVMRGQIKRLRLRARPIAKALAAGILSLPTVGMPLESSGSIRPRPANVIIETSRHGRSVTYYREGKGPRVRLPDFGSPGFWNAYRRASSGGRSSS